MKSLTKPEFQKDIFKNIERITSKKAKNLTNSKKYIVGCKKQYQLYSILGMTFHIEDEGESHSACKIEKKDLGNAYKNWLYKTDTYNNLLQSSLICPFCLSAHSDTIEHFLPKKIFPSYSIVDINLVPACDRCNSAKRQYGSKDEEIEQLFHPYFDNLKKAPWIQIKKCKKNLPGYTFEANENLDEGMKEKVKKTIEVMEIDTFFSTQSRIELFRSINRLESVYDSKGRADLHRELLSLSYPETDDVFPWRSLLFKALSEDSWFISGGVKTVKYWFDKPDAFSAWPQ